MLISSLGSSVSPGENEVWYFESDDCKEFVIVSNRQAVLFQAIHITSNGTKKYSEKTWELLKERLGFKETKKFFYRIPDLCGDGFPILYRNL